MLHHVIEILVLLAVIWFLCGRSRQGFTADPFGTGLKYYTFQSSSASGPGSNAYLSSRGL